METEFDQVLTPLKIDISTGDIITPRAVQYVFHLMLEDCSISVLTYNLETVLAEKLETVVSRATTNTRMRDFYDIHILLKLDIDAINAETLHTALLATSKKRGTFNLFEDASTTIAEIEEDADMQKLWASYQNKFSYASGIQWQQVINSVETLLKISQI